MESNSVCNHTSDNKIGRPRSGSPICFSREKEKCGTFSEKRKIAKLCDKGKFYIKKLTKDA